MSVFTMSRRTILKGGAAALGTMALSPLAAWAQTARFPIADAARNPLNLADGTAIEGIFFEGGYGIDYINHAADVMKELHAGTQISVTGIQGVADRLRPRFIAGNPPDVVDPFVQRFHQEGRNILASVDLRVNGEVFELPAAELCFDLGHGPLLLVSEHCQHGPTYVSDCVNIGVACSPPLDFVADRRRYDDDDRRYGKKRKKRGFLEDLFEFD
jgi:hypothetical protein